MSENLVPQITGLDFRNYLLRFHETMGRPLCPPTDSKERFEAWKPVAQHKVLELLRIDHLEPQPFNLQVVREEQKDGYLFRHIVYQTLPDLYVPAFLLIPDNVKTPTPAILCPPGHGAGKQQVVFSDDGTYHHYPEVLAREGYICLVPEHVSFGERANPTRGFGGCGFDHEALNLLGSTVIGYRSWECQRAVDLLATMPEVDMNRLGCAGLSLGGEMTLYLCAIEERIKVAVNSCFLTSFAGTFLKEPHCTCGYVPGMARFFEHADIAAIFAPKPLLVHAGTKDGSFLVSDAQAAVDELKVLYGLHGASDRVSLTVFEGGHEFHVPSSVEWFNRWL